jgi:iron complex outermembrane receptor protein
MLNTGVAVMIVCFAKRYLHPLMPVRQRVRQRVLQLVFLLTFLQGTAQAEDDFLFDLTLVDLMNIEMVSSSKFKQELSDIPAAAYVITRDDIKNAGVTDLPQLLELVPGLFITQASSSSWSVGVRGFNSVFSNKMLVMIDGRSLFSPLFSGVFWEQIDLYIPDIERIEVIRGVGSTVWGANAVNGVINIITKSTLDNESTQMYVNSGTQTEYDAGIRFGTKIADQSYARIYLKSKSMDSGNFSRDSIDDHWSSDAIGIKWEHFAGSDSYILSGDYIEQRLNDTTVNTSRIPVNQVPIDNESANLSFQWQRQVSTDQAFTLSSQLQRANRVSDFYQVDDRTANIEFDLSYRWQNHQLLFGGGARQNEIDFDPGIAFELAVGDTQNDDQHERGLTRSTIYSAYMQDEWQIYPAHTLTLGTKFESHKHDHSAGNRDYYASLWLPTMRYRFNLSVDTRLWAAISHTARIPSISEQSLQIPVGVLPANTEQNPFPWPLELFTSGNGTFDKETLLSFEVGLRTRLNSTNTLDITTYHNRYNDVRGFRVNDLTCQLSHLPAPACFTHDTVVQRAEFVNGLSMSVSGAEISWQSRLADDLTLTANYSYMNQVIDPLSPGVFLDSTLLITPSDQLALQVDWQAIDKLNLRFKYQYTGGFEDGIDSLFSVDDHFLKHQNMVDVSAAYELSSQWTVKLTANNLFKERGQQWLPEFAGASTSETQRRFTFGVDVKF